MLLLLWAISLVFFFTWLEYRQNITRSDIFRALTHTSYFALNSALLMVVVPLFLTPTFGIGQKGFSSVPLIVQFFVLTLILDFLSYCLHFFSHRNRFLYYFHQVHHSDNTVDASTAFRMHIVQMFYSLIPDLFVLFLLCPSRTAYLCYATFTQLNVIFHHSQIRSPQFLSNLLVTPRFHLEHHKEPKNFGAVFSFWDLFFGTATKVPSTLPVGFNVNPFSWKELFLPKPRRIYV